MQLTKQFTPLEKSAVKLTVTVAKDDVAKSYKENVAKLSKQIQIPGFRKGHVPLNVLEKKYGDALKADVLGEIIDDTLNEVFKDETEKENRPLPYCQPKLEEMPALDLEKDLVYTVSYDIFPKVKVENFKGIEVKEAQVEIGEKELAEELKAIQERNATIEDKADGETVKKDDIVTIDYCELDDAGNVVEGSKREGFVFTVGTGENIYKIDDEIVGMKKDEPKEITKTYAADDADKDLAGKTKKIRVTVKAMKIRRLPALDDDLAQDVSEKFKTLDDLKNDLKINMESAATRRVNELKSNSLLEQLIEKNPFEIPASMLETELN
ncbi:MAG: trigger factor, partial [Treponemataceae bacterium]|nr:trigger factor [Treponemataceae bacterium]